MNDKTGVEPKSIDAIVQAIWAVRDTAFAADQHWLFQAIHKAVNAVENITGAILDQRVAEQSDDDAAETPRTRRQRRAAGGGAIAAEDTVTYGTNGSQSERVMRP